MLVFALPHLTMMLMLLQTISGGSAGRITAVKVICYSYGICGHHQMSLFGILPKECQLHGEVLDFLPRALTVRHGC